MPKRSTHTYPYRQLVYLLCAFCAGLIFPVFVFFIWILNQPQVASPTLAPEQAPGSSIDLEAPDLFLKFNESEFTEGVRIEIDNAMEGIGGGWSMTSEFWNLLQRNPSCDTFSQSTSYRLPDYFSNNLEHCQIMGRENMILISSYGIQSAYEGLPRIEASIIALTDHGSHFIFHDVLPSLGDLKENVTHTTLMEKYPGADFGNDAWTKLADEYETSLELYVAESEEMQYAKTELKRIMMLGLNINPERDFPYLFTFYGTGIPSYFFVNSKGELSQIDITNALWNTTARVDLSEIWNQPHYISPNEEWLAFEIGYRDVSTVSLFHIPTQRLYGPIGQKGNTWRDIRWLPDNRLRLGGAWCMEIPIGGVGVETFECGNFESISSMKPWEMKEVAE